MNEGQEIEGFIKLIDAMQEQELEDKELLDEASDIFEELLNVNIIHAEVLVQLAHLLVDYNLTKDQDPAAELELDETRGLALNIGTALRDIDMYSNVNVPPGKDLEDLYDAIISLIREAERNILTSDE